MAIPLENMVGYIRTRPKQDNPESLEIYIDQLVCWKVHPKGAALPPVPALPPGCVGVLYSVPETGRLEVRYPEE